MYTERSVGRITGNTVYDVQVPQTNNAGGGSLINTASINTASGAEVEELSGNTLVAS